jgi:hypothetical protein
MIKTMETEQGEQGEQGERREHVKLPKADVHNTGLNRTLLSTETVLGVDIREAGGVLELEKQRKSSSERLWGGENVVKL